MRTWMLAIAVLVVGALALGACGGDSNNNDGPGNGENAVSDVAYELSIRFDPEIYEAGHDEDAVDVLLGYDQDADVLSLDSFPPILNSTLVTDADGFCDTVRGDLQEAAPSVSEMTCKPADDDSPGLSPIDSAFRVTISFNTTVEQADLDATGTLLRGYDPNGDYLIQESFPPTGVAHMNVDDAEFCATIVPELEAESYVDSVSCGPPPEPSDGDPDEPVSDANDLRY